MIGVDVKKYIIDNYGDKLYLKAINYKKKDINYRFTNNYSKKYYMHVFSVSKDYKYSIIKVTVDNRKVEASCSCYDYLMRDKCEHCAAVLYHYADMIFPEPVDPFKATSSILDEYKDTNKNSNIKEQVGLELELEFDNDNVYYRPFIGLKKKYVINTETKFSNFMDVYKNGGTYSFGKSFEYNSNNHYLSNEDSKLLEFLYGYEKHGYYGYYEKNNVFKLNERETDTLLSMLKNKTFKIKDYGEVDGVVEGLPTNFNLTKDNGEYKLEVDDYDNYRFLSKDFFKYVVYNHKLYIIPLVYQKLFYSMYDNEINYLTFKQDKVEVFKEGLLKKVKDNIIVDESIDDIVISGKPEVSLYFDLYKDMIKCDIKLKYKDIEINYFDKNVSVVRDDESENEVLKDLQNNAFIVDNKKIYIDEIDDIGEFLETGIKSLQEKYNIYTSKKLDNMNIFKKSNISSNFSIGQDGIMSYGFSVDNINLEELNNVFASLKAKKKYYKLKNGSLINLEEDKELQELNGIISDLDINTKDLQSGNIEIPKYRALYIDSLKNNKYKDIKTSNSFDEFINNFKEYKNSKINLEKRDEEILREYQKDGVKWLYTLYKCDLGGILADEMGLGKTIQTICLIKEILKEKKDAKIMIVCPTALVYNWKKEFDKFGPELKYITIAEQKEKRKEIIKDFDKYNIFITSYGLIRNDNDEYEDKNFELCIIDEAQAIKNYQAGITKEIKKIKARTKIALTGTPVENNVSELWSIFDFIMPGYLNSITKFREKYNIKDVDEESLKTLNNLNYQIKPFILRRKKKDVIKDLPDKLENNIILELPEEQKVLYVKELKEAQERMNELIATQGYTKARFEILKLLLHLREICIDPSVIYENYNYPSVKLEKLVEIVKDYVAEGHKILIFSSFKRMLDKVKNIFDKESISNYTITGDVKGKVRTELVDKFNDDETNCFLITLKAGGVGLNLTGADIVIHLDIWWNPQAENQATDRAHRIGQKNKVTVIRLVTKGTVEERILELQEKKKILSDNLIEGKSDTEVLNSITEKEMKKLLSYGEDE